ncbi:tetratricopeptide repeat protein, partial [bacterium]|nr:tetratricopeptide repeat protein [bacterium]
MHRPYGLLDALHKNDIIDDTALDSANRTIVSSQLLASLREIRRIGATDAKTVRKLILEQNGILGISSELAEDLVQLYANSRLDAVRRFISLIEDSDLTRLGDYWRVRLSDEVLSGIFSDLDQTLGREGLPESETGESSVRSLIDIAGSFRKGDKLLRAFLTYKTALENMPSGSEGDLDDRLVILKSLAELARSLNRFEDAAEYYGTLVDLNDAHSRVDLESHLEHVSTLDEIGRTRTERIDTLIEEGIKKSKSQGDIPSELKFLCLKGWLASARGNHEEAQQILDSIEVIATKHEYHELYIRINYARGVMYWRKGLFAEAEACLTEGFELAREKGLLPKAVKTISTLAGQSNEQGEYLRATRYGRIALKYITATNSSNILAYLSHCVSGAHSRLGDHKKAEFWLTRVLASGVPDIDRIQMLSFYWQRGYSASCRGDYDAARRLLRQALNLAEPSSPARHKAKVYHNLAEIAMCQGRKEHCDDYLARGRAAIADLEDEASLAELDLIELLNDL